MQRAPVGAVKQQNRLYLRICPNSFTCNLHSKHSEIGWYTQSQCMRMYINGKAISCHVSAPKGSLHAISVRSATASLDEVFYRSECTYVWKRPCFGAVGFQCNRKAEVLSQMLPPGYCLHRAALLVVHYTGFVERPLPVIVRHTAVS